MYKYETHLHTYPVSKCASAGVRETLEYSAKKVLLCDSSKIGKTYFYNMGNISDVDAVVSDVDALSHIDAK